jgi:hypothetical protein
MPSLRRRLGIDGNLLRRPLDRLQAATNLLLVLVFVVAGPVAAFAVGSSAHRVVGADANHERATRERVDATILGRARDDRGNGMVLPAALARVEARWTVADGTEHAGDVVVHRSRRAGDVVSLWIGPDGTSTSRPLGRHQVLAIAVGAGAGAALAVASVLLITAGAVHLVLDRRRARQWEQEWRAVAPLWYRGHA